MDSTRQTEQYFSTGFNFIKCVLHKYSPFRLFAYFLLIMGEIVEVEEVGIRGHLGVERTCDV